MCLQLNMQEDCQRRAWLLCCPRTPLLWTRHYHGRRKQVFGAVRVWHSTKLHAVPKNRTKTVRRRSQKAQGLTCLQNERTTFSWNQGKEVSGRERKSAPLGDCWAGTKWERPQNGWGGPITPRSLTGNFESTHGRVKGTRGVRLICGRGRCHTLWQ